LREAWISSSKLIVTPVNAITLNSSEIARPIMEWTCNNAALVEDALMDESNMSRGAGKASNAAWKALCNRRLFDSTRDHTEEIFAVPINPRSRSL
jgi:hypothetical protein